MNVTIDLKAIDTANGVVWRCKHGATATWNKRTGDWDFTNLVVTNIQDYIIEIGCGCKPPCEPSDWIDDDEKKALERSVEPCFKCHGSSFQAIRFIEKGLLLQCIDCGEPRGVMFR